MRLRARNPRCSEGYYLEPLTAQHVLDGVAQIVSDAGRFIWFSARYMTSKKFRMHVARTYNRAMFGHIPTNQIYVVSDDGEMRQLREEERTWPE